MLPEALRDSIAIEAVESADFLVGGLFRRKYGHPPPPFGRHIVAFYREADGALHVASYLHVWTKGSIGLPGGACTDGGVIRRMSEQQRAAVDAAGGLMKHTLLYAFERWQGELDAFFTYCGDERALSVIPHIGFVPTQDPHLFARWNSDLADAARERLYLEAHAIGPF